jgi:hypothetical protein
MTTFTWLMKAFELTRFIDNVKKFYSDPLYYLSGILSLVTSIAYFSIGLALLFATKKLDFLHLNSSYIDIFKYINMLVTNHAAASSVVGCIFVAIGVLILKKFIQPQEESKDKTFELKSLVEFSSTLILEKINHSEKSIASLINRDVFIFFETDEEIYKYLVDRYQHIEKSIDITHFGNGIPSDRVEDETYSEFYKSLRKIMQEEKIKVRRVCLARNKKSLNWMKELVKDFPDNPKFNLGCYSGNLSITLTSFMILDETEVLVTHGKKELSGFCRTVSIKDRNIVKFYRDYFNDLYVNSIILKSDVSANQNEFNKLENQMRSLSLL